MDNLRTIAGLWRWRRNPLCRGTDRGEAWLTLCAAVLITVGAPLTGLFSGLAADADLQRIADGQRRHRHHLWATTEQLLPRPQNEPERSQDAGYPVLAFWTSPDGTTRTGSTTVGHPVRPGDRFRIWTDGNGNITTRPMSRATAGSHAIVAGVVAGVISGLALEAGRRLAVAQLLRRRYARWDAEWARFGPDSGRAGAGN